MKTINYKKAARIAKMMQRDRMPVKNAKTDTWIYYFDRQWSCVINGVFVRRYDDRVIATDIEEHPGAIVTIVQMGDEKVTPPDVVANHKNLKTITVTDESEFVDMMSEETGVEITVDDLKPKSVAPGIDDRKSTPVNMKRVTAIIDRLRGKQSLKPRLFCAGDYPITAAQRAIGMKIRALILKTQGK